MEAYVAIPKAIIDICSNGCPKTSEPLGIFFVNSECKKGLFGKTTVTGFKEVITGEKIVNRISYPTDYSTIYIDIDCKVDNYEQIGDLAWEIIDKSTADKILPPEELKKYLALSPEEIREQLQDIRINARKIAQNQRNLEATGKFNRIYMISNGIYAAIPKAIIDIHWNGVPETSEPLGLFFVKPECKKGLLGKMTVTGFKEVITGEKIADRISYPMDYTTLYEDIDCMVENREQIGDLAWEIVDKSTADRILPPEELKKHLALSPEEIREQLQSIRMSAKTIAHENWNLKTPDTKEGR